MVPLTAPGEVTLRPITLADADDMRHQRRQPWWHPDYPREDDVDGASMIRSDGDPSGSRHVLLDGVAVGSIGFFGPPSPADDGVSETEVGFGLVAEVRGRGVMTTALRQLLAYADGQGFRVRARAEPGNVASLRTLAAAGFTELRGSDDEGHLIMARPLPQR